MTVQRRGDTLHLNSLGVANRVPLQVELLSGQALDSLLALLFHPFHAGGASKRPRS